MNCCDQYDPKTQPINSNFCCHCGTNLNYWKDDIKVLYQTQKTEVKDDKVIKQYSIYPVNEEKVMLKALVKNW